jgi:hypothetical protein
MYRQPGGIGVTATAGLVVKPDKAFEEKLVAHCLNTPQQLIIIYPE